MSGSLLVTLGGSLELILRPPPPDIIPVVTVKFGPFSATARGTNMAYTLPSDMFVTAQIAYQDASGNPATVDGAVTWSSSDSTIVAVVGDAQDSTQCRIEAVGPVGSAQITATADADLGSGTRSLVTLLDVTVVAGEAVTGSITITSTPAPIPPSA